MTVVMLRSNHVNPDPRVEKEVGSLLTRYRDVLVLAWDRDGQLAKDGFLYLPSGRARVRRSRVRASYGGGSKNVLALARFQFFLIWSLWQERATIEVIHACDLSTGIAGALMSRLLGVRFVYDIFDYYVDAFPVPRRLRELVEWLEVTVINRADAVIIVADSRADQIAKAVPRKLCVIHNSPRPISSHRIVERDSDVRRFVYVGVLEPHRLLEEALQLFSSKPEWELHIGGFGTLSSEVTEYAAKNPNIRFYGKLAYDDALTLSATADLLFATYDPVIPNHRYSSPNKFYEALMLGVPILVSKNTGVDSLVAKYKVGVAIDHSVESFERHASALLNDHHFRETVRTDGPKIFESHFSWSIMERRLLDLYAGLS